MEAAKQLKVGEIQEELKRGGGCKALGGRKEVILAHLVEAIKNNITVSIVDEIEKQDTCLSSLSPMTDWKPLSLSLCCNSSIAKKGIDHYSHQLNWKQKHQMQNMDSLKHSNNLSLV